MDTKGIELFTAPTPNGWKISVALEELALPYTVRPVNLLAGEQRKPEFLKRNPNGKIPVIVDHDNDGLVLFESGAILIYLAEKAGRLLPTDPAARWSALQWLMFQMGGLGPMMGQANVFHRYLPEKMPLAIARYQKECRRLFEVLDGRLGEAQWLAGEEYSIADIANWCWARTYKWSGVQIDGLTNLSRWMEAMNGRSACRKGIEVPIKLPDLDDDGEQSKAFANAARTLLQR